MGWRLERIPLQLEKRRKYRITYWRLVRWEWESYFSAYGLIYGYAFTKRTAEKRLLEAERELLSQRP